MKRTTTMEREVFFVAGRLVRRLIKKEGRALMDSEQKTEDARVKKVVEERLKTQAKNKPTGNGMIREILAVAKLSNARRVELNGRSTLAFDFAGDPKAKATGMAGSAAKKTSGTVWIDEKDRQVAKIAIQFDENYNVAGGLLACLQKGTRIDLEQSPVADGLWLQTASDQKVQLRVLVKGIRENVRVRNSDFRKFDVGMVERIGLVTPKISLGK